MRDDLRHRSVAVAVLYDEATNSFMLWHNKRWRGYAFPMRSFERRDSVDPVDVALSALNDREFPLSLPNATARPLDRVSKCLFSDGVHQFTYYDYHVMAVDAGQTIDQAGLDPDIRFFTYDELLNAPNVTASSKFVARSAVEAPKVAVALITRSAGRGREFLLVMSKNHNYFFPASRVTTRATAAEIAIDALRHDLGYEGELGVSQQVEVSLPRDAQRLGPRERTIQFVLCSIEFPGIDLSASGNELEQAATALQTRTSVGQSSPIGSNWGWFTEDELHSRTDVSGIVHTLLLAIPTSEESRSERVSYHPRPIDTSEVGLSPEILELTEQLAKNTHDIWARQRISEGWKYGPRRNDDRKEHPCLVPYAELPETEKEYDRNTAMATLKAIVALGYRIER